MHAHVENGFIHSCLNRERLIQINPEDVFYFGLYLSRLDKSRFIRNIYTPSRRVGMCQGRLVAGEQLEWVRRSLILNARQKLVITSKQIKIFRISKHSTILYSIRKKSSMFRFGTACSHFVKWNSGVKMYFFMLYLHCSVLVLSIFFT